MTSSRPPIDISTDHWAIVRDVLDAHVPDYEIWAFGSRAKGTARPYSDLDLVIVTHEPLARAVASALSDAFSQSDLPWMVDIIDWAATGVEFRKRIEQDRLVLRAALRSG